MYIKRILKYQKKLFLLLLLLFFFIYEIVVINITKYVTLIDVYMCGGCWATHTYTLNDTSTLFVTEKSKELINE